MNTSKNEEIQMNMQGREKSNNDCAEYIKAHKTMIDFITSEEKHGFIIPEKIFTGQEADALTRLNYLANNLANKSLRFILDVREYTQMVAYVNFFCGKNGRVKPHSPMVQ